jgi:hypothetical protein
MAQDWSVHALVCFYSAGSDLPWAVLYRPLGLEFVDMKTNFEMAKKAGIEEAFSLKQDQYLVRFKDDSLERFAALIRADEREACAKQLDALGCDHCAAAIRARGNT